MRAHKATGGWLEIEWPRRHGSSVVPSDGDLLDTDVELVIEQVQELHEHSRRAIKRLFENLGS